jgi:O-antigen ligase
MTDAPAAERAERADPAGPGIRGMPPLRGDIALEPLLAWMTVFLVFVGEWRIPIGGSELYCPLALFPAAVLAVLRGASGRLFVPYGAMALAVVIGCGLLGTFASEEPLLRRSMVAIFPIGGALLVMFALAGVPDLPRISRSATLWGGSLLAVWVILLGLLAIRSDLPFYEAKLIVETPLGRSNYLTAFLLVVLATAWRRYPAIALLAFLAILASLSRGGLAVTALFFGFLVLAQLRLAILGAAAIVVAGLAATAYLATVDLSLEHSVSNEGMAGGLTSLASATNRVVLWQASRELLEASPWLGVGPNGFRTWVEGAPNVEDVWGPHSAILLLWLNYGVAGTLAYLTYLHMLWVARHRAVHAVGGPWPDPLACALLALAVFAVTEPLVGSASFEVLLTCLYMSVLPTYPTSRRPADPIPISAPRP